MARWKPYAGSISGTDRNLLFVDHTITYGATELAVRCRLHREIESVTEMWRPEMLQGIITETCFAESLSIRSGCLKLKHHIYRFLSKKKLTRIVFVYHRLPFVVHTLIGSRCQADPGTDDPLVSHPLISLLSTGHHTPLEVDNGCVVLPFPSPSHIGHPRRSPDRKQL
jgi:hypothetical protein